ncbi:MAG: D-alanyl-D-alanine carboxypeptidase [Clostridia bacterium]|nr:D-alanyl-D-alanine carboxypeptidase [Clostridia bacterium]
MKKILTYFLAFLLSVGMQACGNGGAEVVMGDVAVTLRAPAAFVYDCTSGDTVLHGSGRVYPASLTKLLTCLTALDVMDPQTVIVPGDEVYLPGEGSSSAFIRPHHALTLEMLVEAMLLPSGNDAAYAVAAACGRVMADDASLSYTDAAAVFVDGMNDYAARLGCTDSRFTVPDGYAGDENYSTAADMAKIAKAASENELIMKYAGLHTDSVTYASGHTNTWVNTNLQLDPDSPYYNEHVTGMKTGSLPGNYCLITRYDNGETDIIIGIFGAQTDEERYGDTERILDGLAR